MCKIFDVDRHWMIPVCSTAAAVTAVRSIGLLHAVISLVIPPNQYLDVLHM